MLALDSGDKIQGDASVASKVDYTLHGLDNNAIKQLADGQLADSIGDIYTADSTDVVATVTLCNTHTSAVTVNLYLLPSGGTARRLIPKDTSLGAGSSLHTDGKSIVVMSASDGALSAYAAHKDSHDPNDGTDPLDTAEAAEIAGVVAAGTGTSHSLARADHVHAIVHAITDNHLLTVDDAAAADDDFARFTADGIEGLTVAEAITALFGAALPENVGITLDAALSADEKFSGIVEDGTAGATVDFGDLLYHDVTAGEWLLAKADAAATSAGKLGINVTIAQKTDGQAITVLLWGKVRSDGDYNFTVDAPVFISAATAGDMTSTAPSGTTNFVVRIVGYGNTADELFFCPDKTYLELV